MDLDRPVYALDATLLDRCRSVLPRAKFRRRKAAVKRHTRLELRGHIPVLLHITPGNMHEVKLLDELGIEAGSIDIMARA